MKRNFGVAFGVAFAILTLSCSFDQSGLTFDDGDVGSLIDAPSGRDGGAGSSDAGRVTVDANDDAPCDLVCPGTCRDDVCEIDCTGPVDCSGDVTCPAGFDCVVSCGADDCPGDILCGPGVGTCTIGCGAGSCTGSITCAAEECVLDCTGIGACDGSITCGPGRCDITCLSETCNGSLDCSSSCSCDVYCLGGNSCADGSQCPGSCATGNNGCTTFPPFCDSCER